MTEQQKKRLIQLAVRQKKWLILAAALVVVVVIAVFAWQRYAARHNEGVIVSGNGRIEATEIDVAARTAGRVKEILVHEGDFVKAGQIVARMDTEAMEASRREADAQLHQARSAVAAAQSQLAQRESDKAAAQSAFAQRQAELDAAKTHLSRTVALAAKGFVSSQAVDDANTRLQTTEAAARAARAQISAAESAIASARSQVAGTQSSVAAAQANLERIQADIDDTVLKAPRDGRVQYLVAHTGEVVGAGGRVLNLIDLSDVYLTFFLSTSAAGRVALGDEVHLVLDAVPQYVFPAHISFVASEAQFTPKTVETKSEREKLMFRVRAQLSPELLSKYNSRVKTGLPGVAYVRLDPNVPWPERLQVKLPQ